MKFNVLNFNNKKTVKSKSVKPDKVSSFVDMDSDPYDNSKDIAKLNGEIVFDTSTNLASENLDILISQIMSTLDSIGTKNEKYLYAKKHFSSNILSNMSYDTRSAVCVFLIDYFKRKDIPYSEWQITT